MALTETEEIKIKELITAYNNAKKLSELPDIGSDLDISNTFFEIVDTEESKKISFSQLASHIDTVNGGENMVTLNTDQTITGQKTFGQPVTANGFIKSGGTSSQFLKADGSVDSNTYLTDSSSLAWRNLTGKPTTLSGYGVTDAVTLDTDQTVTGTKTFTDIRLKNQPENVAMPYFLGIDTYEDGGAVKYITASKVANAISVYTKTETESKYLSKTEAQNNYLTKTDASNTYQTSQEVQNIVNQTVYGTTTPSTEQQSAKVVTTENLTTTLSNYQEKLTPGENITITGNTISAKSPDLTGYAREATTLAGYGITDAKIADGTITLGTNSITPLTEIPSEYVTETELNGKGYATTTQLEGKSDTGHTHDVATSSVNGFLSASDKSWINFMNGANTATSLVNVSISKHMCVVTIGANNSFSLASTLAKGREIHVIVKNSSASEITVTMPTSGGYVSLSGDSLKVPANGYSEINVISDGTNMYIRAI